jgi:hypothetical protein
MEALFSYGSVDERKVDWSYLFLKLCGDHIRLKVKSTGKDESLEMCPGRDEGVDELCP